ncbi:hypothetical protein EJ06DRAFT_543679 [Trichodelitschia bisporula]|uniref:Ankyrin repeat protein nuc-2 n=1 Tax=Trichodelitschia bisporula TaxID=703511 RepID=A0A6G1HSJ4_9PEZI|nr:hypothetical protein EJ06DRAFT_543679 [Trichodelitschia bisporula]
MPRHDSLDSLFEFDTSVRRRCFLKFGKHIQKRQLEIPEYAASFVDYKALKKLIKALSATPILPAQNEGIAPGEVVDPQQALQANKATFFFRLERELEKVNTFYLQKEAELKLRLSSLLDQKRSMQSQQTHASRLSSRYIALEEGFHQFSSDLTKLQQFIEINAAAFSKILKKWDKTSKSETKVVYLSRAVEVQPCFNRDVISDLSDQATTNLLDFAAWAEGENIQPYISGDREADSRRTIEQEDDDLDVQILQAITAGNLGVVQDWANRIKAFPTAGMRITKAFLGTCEEAPEQVLKLLLDTGMVDLSEIDEINHRNILHKAAISGRMALLVIGLSGNVDVRAADIYGRIPLHYACMHGSVEMIQDLIGARPDTINLKDHDNFTPLIHAIVHSHLPCIQKLLELNAGIDPTSESDHNPLNLACQHGSLLVVQELLARRPQILPDAEGLYPQHLVARSSKDPQLLFMLRNYGADLDQPDKLYGWTPLFHAASEGNVECLQALLSCGADPSILDEKGLSASYYAIWEGYLDCMKLLAEARGEGGAQTRRAERSSMPPPPATPGPMSKEADSIPPFILPPPIIPVRRYGHNFLDSKTFVIISFANLGYDAIQFYDDNKYPAARITISSKSSDLIPRNLLLPIQDEFKIISFQIDNLETFSIDFDIYPTFGAKVIARTVASSKVFTGRASSSDQWHLELLDPRLRAIGRISFNFQVVKPFSGIPLEITHFATYWKATNQTPHSSSLITGSSLSGDYVRLFVQMTADGVPVLWPGWKVIHEGLAVPVGSLSYEQFVGVGRHQGAGNIESHISPSTPLPQLHALFLSSFSTLASALSVLPPSLHVELHLLYPSRQDEETFGLRPPRDINAFADAVLGVVFEHARTTREGPGVEGWLRSVVFSSANEDVCTAVNWKQPNYPVLLCNDLGAQGGQPSGCAGGALSVKEAVQIARMNNFMGLVCSQRLLDLAPKLIESIKTAGLVLIADVGSSNPEASAGHRWGVPVAREGVDGTVRANGVLRFNDSVDM